MAYDSTDFVVTETPVPVRDPKSITDPRERVAYLRDFLRAMPTDSPHFNYLDWHSTTPCGTSACIGGWASELFVNSAFRYSIPEARKAMGLTERQGEDLFFNSDGIGSNAHQAANVLDNYLATGWIDWSVA